MSAKTSVSLNRGSAAQSTFDWNKRQARRPNRQAGLASLLQNLPLSLRQWRAVPHPAAGVRPQRTDLLGAANRTRTATDEIWCCVDVLSELRRVKRNIKDRKVSHSRHHHHFHPLPWVRSIGYSQWRRPGVLFLLTRWARISAFCA